MDSALHAPTVDPRVVKTRSENRTRGSSILGTAVKVLNYQQFKFFNSNSLLSYSLVVYATVYQACNINPVYLPDESILASLRSVLPMCIN